MTEHFSGNYTKESEMSKYRKGNTELEYEDEASIHEEELEDEDQVSFYEEELKDNKMSKYRKGYSEKEYWSNDSVHGDEFENMQSVSTAAILEGSNEAKHISMLKKNLQQLVERLLLIVDRTFISTRRIRQTLSDSETILVGILFFEGLIYLQKSFPMTYKAVLGPTNLSNLISNKATTTIYLPNLAVLLYTDFWYPLFSWGFFLLLIPLVIAYFFNLEISKHPYFSPLTFAVARLCLILYASRDWEILDGLFTRVSPSLFITCSAVIGAFAFFDAGM